MNRLAGMEALYGTGIANFQRIQVAILYACCAGSQHGSLGPSQRPPDNFLVRHKDLIDR